MLLHVLSQKIFLSERFLAKLTAEGFLTSVDFLVRL